ncbi:MAG TPA: diaminopropionate ammonia-lyase, partial [Actinomycetota bacterium]|nr:diaminopropionate ammonia-lyase [Actinomycetota bacterium]
MTHDRLTRELVLNPVSALREVPPGPGLLPPPSRAPLALHRRLPGYAVTPLREVPALAGACGVGRVWVRDESTR